ncbi:MAG: urea transporter [Bacteroidota bacterium]
MDKIKSYFHFFRTGITASYNQVFFSDNKWFALALFIASFTDVSVGISGLTSVFMALIIARVAGFNTLYILSGTYTYNVLLVGLTMGAYFQLNAVFFVILLLASIITLLLSVWLSARMASKKLPLLSLPFVLGIWIILLSTRSFGAMGLNERGIFTFNELWSYGGMTFVTLYQKLNDLGLPQLLIIYLKSMGAIFFQNNIISGLLITLGLIIFSRIAFSLSVIGFLSGYFFCTLVQGNLSDIEYSYIGFNYILTAMAIGGFFLIPSVGSYVLAAVSAPLISLFVGALSKITTGYMLSLYSLPFTMVVLLILYALNNRYSIKYLYIVQYQLYSPEKNFYLFHNYTERFKKDSFVHIHLPFYGEWTVSQGHSGNMTHKDEWRFALDFVVEDDTKKTYRMPGQQVSDFYCYHLPVLAPADGNVITIQDGIADNVIGDVDLHNNWGNTIIIKHTEYLYSKISHLKKDSFKVKVGDAVKKGDVLALCGNSGRSPEPHVHFQLQSTPYIGAKTLDYPISYYVSKNANTYKLHSFAVPKEGDVILRPLPTPLMEQAFHFIPGMKLMFDVNNGKEKYIETWDVCTDIYNLSYLYCPRTKSVAYFTNNGTLFYFTSFTGDKNSLLYYFYLGMHKVLLSYFQDISIEDKFPIEGFYKGPVKIIQDLIAPFFVFLKTSYKAAYMYADNASSPSTIKIRSEAKAFANQRTTRAISFETELTHKTIKRFIVKEKDLCLTAEHIG